MVCRAPVQIRVQVGEKGVEWEMLPLLYSCPAQTLTRLIWGHLAVSECLSSLLTCTECEETEEWGLLLITSNPFTVFV